MIYRTRIFRSRDHIEDDQVVGFVHSNVEYGLDIAESFCGLLRLIEREHECVLENWRKFHGKNPFPGPTIITLPEANLQVWKWDFGKEGTWLIVLDRLVTIEEKV